MEGGPGGVRGWRDVTMIRMHCMPVSTNSYFRNRKTHKNLKPESRQLSFNLYDLKHGYYSKGMCLFHFPKAWGFLNQILDSEKCLEE